MTTEAVPKPRVILRKKGTDRKPPPKPVVDHEG